MKKNFIFPIAIAFLLCLCALLPRAVAQGILRESTDEDKPKIISVVFDDSGSMVGDKDDESSYTTRWVDADYALKALAAMMDPEDQLRLYAMGDYKTEDKIGADINAYNARNKEVVISNLEKKMSGRSYGNTYAYTLDAAQQDFSADDIEKYECWIVILTDGVFNRPEELDAEKLTSKLNTLLQPISGNGTICVAYIPMGNGAVQLTNNADDRIVQENREDGITMQITKLLNRIYKRVRMDDAWTSEYLPIEDGQVVLHTNVPMEKLVVFLQYQGEEEYYLEHESLKENKPEITILDESRRLEAPKYLELESVIQFGGKDDQPIGSTFQPELVKYHTLQGVILTWKRNPKLGADDFSSQTFTIPIQRGCAITAEVYYQPAVSVGYDYLQDGELVEHMNCAFTGRSMDGTEYCLHEGEVSVSLRLLDFQGKSLPDDNSPFLYPGEFKVLLIPEGKETETELRRSGGGYLYTGQAVEGDYKMQIQTPWNELVTQTLSIQERHKPLEIVPVATQIVVDADGEEQRQVQVLIKEDGESLSEESKANLTITCETEDKDLILGSQSLADGGTYVFPVSLLNPAKHQIAKTAVFHIIVSRDYDRGGSNTAELDVELELTSGPHTMEIQCEGGEVNALFCMLRGQRFDVAYVCDGQKLTEEQLKNLEPILTVSEEKLRGLFKIGADKSLVACGLLRWWGISEQTATVELGADYVKYNRQAEGEPLLIKLQIRPVPPVCKAAIFIAVAAIALWAVLCVVKVFTPLHIRKRRFVMSGAVMSFLLDLKRKRNLFLPFYRNAKLVMEAGRNDISAPVPGFEMVIRNSEGGNGYILCNYESFKNSEMYRIGGLPITKNNCNFNNERCFSVKNTYGETVKLQITDKH